MVDRGPSYCCVRAKVQSEMQDNNAPDGGLFGCSREVAEALGVLEVVKKAGLALVPPDEMVAAKMAVFGVGTEQVRAVFQVMISADAEPVRQTR
jgi:hypothetical protein